MPVLYVDTSVLVAAVSNETATALAQDWLAAQEAGRLIICDWTITEMSSALAIKLRTGHITLDHRAAALAAFHRMIADSFTIVPIAAVHFQTAAQFLDQHALGLRAGDALHLAIASHHGAVVHTLDRRLAEAGPALGVPTELLA